MPGRVVGGCYTMTAEHNVEVAVCDLTANLCEMNDGCVDRTGPLVAESGSRQKERVDRWCVKEWSQSSADAAPGLPGRQCVVASVLLRSIARRKQARPARRRVSPGRLPFLAAGGAGLRPASGAPLRRPH